jgi:flagellar biosynthesis regulator FlaF
MIQHHQWSLTELDNMLPFERQIYIILLQSWIKEENERIRTENAKNRGR